MSVLPKVRVSVVAVIVAGGLVGLGAVGAQPASAGPPSPWCPDEPYASRIRGIQGAGQFGAGDGCLVKEVPGVVTAVSARGFWMQDPNTDNNVATSEGIYVSSDDPAGQLPSVGDAVKVAGQGAEVTEGGGEENREEFGPTQTEIRHAAWSVESSGNALPAPVVLGVDRIAPQQHVGRGEPDFDMDANARDFYESMEGMRVAVPRPQIVGPTTQDGELPVVPHRNVDAIRTNASGLLYNHFTQQNTARVLLAGDLVGGIPKASLGDKISNNLVTGVLQFNPASKKYVLQVTDKVKVTPGRRSTVDQPSRAAGLAVASINIDDYGPQTPQSVVAASARQIVRNLDSPDILTVHQVQDDSGPVDDGTLTSSANVARLQGAIKAAGGPAYQARWVDPAGTARDRYDHEIGTNVRSVFLFRTDRGLSFTDIPGGSAQTGSEPAKQGEGTVLTASPGLVNPAARRSSTWDDAAVPLVGQFAYRGKTVFVMGIELKDREHEIPFYDNIPPGAGEEDGDQPPNQAGAYERVAQGIEVREWADRLFAIDPNANLVVTGSVNDTELSETTGKIAGSADTALTQALQSVPQNQRWSYIVEGNSMATEQTFLSPALAKLGGDKAAYTYRVLNLNSPFVNAPSGHDPQITYLHLN